MRGTRCGGYRCLTLARKGPSKVLNAEPDLNNASTEHTYREELRGSMEQSNAFALQHSDLNGFLFAVVGPEPSGMSLSVVSLLARLGVDPWREAGRLASLPKEAAGEWLAQTIAGASSAWPLSDAKVIAARLIPLLPPPPPHRQGGRLVGRAARRVAFRKRLDAARARCGRLRPGCHSAAADDGEIAAPCCCFTSHKDHSAMNEDTADQNPARTAGDLDAKKVQRQLQNDVRSWSANAGEARPGTVPDAARPGAASAPPADAKRPRTRKVSKPAAGVTTEVKPASGKGRPFSMAYTP